MACVQEGQVLLVLLVQVDQLVHKVQLDRQDSLGPLEAPDCEVRPVVQEPQVHKDQTVPQDGVERQETLVAKDCKDSQVTECDASVSDIWNSVRLR